MNNTINIDRAPVSGSRAAADVLRLEHGYRTQVSILLHRLGLRLVDVPGHREIPGSYWGDEEAGLIGNRLLVRDDTPVHSILHEACHYLCMDADRRAGLHTDAGGDYDEENAVCFLQIMLADELPEMGRDRMFRDMDRWGYSFRLGSSRAWFENDADDARQWLKQRGFLAEDGRLLLPNNQGAGS